MSLWPPIYFFFWRWGPERAIASSITRFLGHTQGLLWTSDQLVAETSTLQAGRRLDSNPRSQQDSGRRPTPQTVRPLGLPMAANT